MKLQEAIRKASEKYRYGVTSRPVVRVLNNRGHYVTKKTKTESK